MAGLIEEIQKDSLDHAVPVSTLLRKVKLAAVKLQLSEIDEWVDRELNGYSGLEVPEYRKIKGIPKAFNPYHGWIPIMSDPKSMESISRANNHQSIAAIEDLLKSGDGSQFQQNFSAEKIHLLNRNVEFPFGEMANFIARGALVDVLNKVRNMVLDWAIGLERLGIKGEGISFREEEKIAAKNNPSISIGTMVGFIGNENVVNDIFVEKLDLSQVKDLALQLRKNKASLVEAGAKAEELSSAVEGLLSEVNKEKPRGALVKGFLTDVRSALAGAAGNIMAAGALSLIGKILGV